MSDIAPYRQPSFAPILLAGCVMILAAVGVAVRGVILDSPSPLAMGSLVIVIAILLALFTRLILESHGSTSRTNSGMGRRLATLPVLALCGLLLCNDIAQTLRMGRVDAVVASFANWRLSVGVLALLIASLVLHLIGGSIRAKDQLAVFFLLGISIGGDLTAISLLTNWAGEQFALGLLPVQARLGTTIIAFFIILIVFVAVQLLLRLMLLISSELGQFDQVTRLESITTPLHHAAVSIWITGYFYFLIQTKSY